MLKRWLTRWLFVSPSVSLFFFFSCVALCGNAVVEIRGCLQIGAKTNVAGLPWFVRGMRATKASPREF